MKVKMTSLDNDLQKPKMSFDEFGTLTKRILRYLPNVISSYNDKNNYRICRSDIAGTIKYIRPINTTLFIEKVSIFSQKFKKLKFIFQKIKDQETLNTYDSLIIDEVLYTMQQSIGAGLDLLVNPNSARKHVGNRFEELIKCIFTELDISNKKIVLQIPYQTDEEEKTYKCENDLILSPYKHVISTSNGLDEKEIVVSIKTSSKDRMGKIFIDKILLEKFVEHPQKVIGIFHNDVQRKDEDNISYTLVSGLFMVYSKFLVKLDGVYYLDPPPSAMKKPFSDYMKPFSELITKDLKNLLSP